MATSQVTLDSVITVKVNFEGVTRRAKMPLRDMVAGTLEDRVRSFLHIPNDFETVLERYSDSASSYVVLDPKNASVYKQLYRAAKAKSKLKLRVTILKPADEASRDLNAPKVTASSAVPTLIDIPSVPTEAPSAVRTKAPAVPAESNPWTTATPSEPSQPARPTVSKTYDSATLKTALQIAEESDFRREVDARFSSIKSDLAKDIVTLLPLAKLGRVPPPVCPSVECAKFAICCNKCDQTTPGVHYHCSTCEDGDFDLCQSCVDQGVTCDGEHWLIKRTTINGVIVTSTTETLPPKPKAKKEAEKSLPKLASPELLPILKPMENLRISTRTCNCCVQERPEAEFIHCRVCEDYDLCQLCFVKDTHGHHPKHDFEAAVAGTSLPEYIKMKLSAGRNTMHQAICDGCDKFIAGVRHKCLDCPDWDLCGRCMENSGLLHPKHRFVPIYESLAEINAATCPGMQTVHQGICCDGPHCSSGKGYPTYIRGIRYKCAVCPDHDFCAGCEASPWNRHNKTHPLIKLKTPVRNVSVLTTGETSDGQKMPAMGDRSSSDKTPATQSINTVQTVVDVKPEPNPAPATPPKYEEVEKKAEVEEDSKSTDKKAPSSSVGRLRATFRRDLVPDGTILPPNHAFEQTWLVKNNGNVPWPSGCSAQFVSGDYMGHVDSKHPAGISELVSTSKSTVCYTPLAPGQEFAFTVLLRTPPRPGKAVSNWRLTTADNQRFGDMLWCNVNVRAVKSEINAKTLELAQVPVKAEEPTKKEIPVEQEEGDVESSQMIFPKLDKESPEHSMHEESSSQKQSEDSLSTPDNEEFEECDNDDEWDVSEDGFMTDEEYDILDASDEEFLEEQQKKLHNQ